MITSPPPKFHGTRGSPYCMTYLSGVDRLLPGGRGLGSWLGEDVEVAGCVGLLLDTVRGDAAGGAVARDLTDRVSAMSRRSRLAARQQVTSWWPRQRRIV